MFGHLLFVQVHVRQRAPHTRERARRGVVEHTSLAFGPGLQMTSVTNIVLSLALEKTPADNVWMLQASYIFKLYVYTKALLFI